MGLRVGNLVGNLEGNGVENGGSEGKCGMSPTGIPSTGVF